MWSVTTPSKIRDSTLTRISLPIKVVFGIAVALQFQSRLLSGWAMGEWYVVVRDIVEEVDFFLLQ